MVLGLLRSPELPTLAPGHTSLPGVFGCKELQVKLTRGGWSKLYRLLSAKLEMVFQFRKYPLPPDQFLSPFDQILKRASDCPLHLFNKYISVCFV